MLVPVILVGGSGSRLAPISTPQQPKPFIDLLNTGESLFQTTLKRAQATSNVQPIIVGATEHSDLIKAQLETLKVDAHIILEPCARNTAPAVIAATLLAQTLHGNHATLLVMPADHFIGDQTYFVDCIHRSEPLALDQKLVIFGITPSTPNTHYGYIHHTASGEFKGFKEKPDLSTATHYIATQRYLWNSGFFLANVRHLLEELEQHTQECLACVQQALPSAASNGVYKLTEAYASAMNLSIDYALLERSQNIHLVKYDNVWSDLGTWPALYEHWPKEGNTAYHSGLSLRLTQNAHTLSLWHQQQWLADV